MRADKTVRERRVPRSATFHGLFEELGIPPDTLSVSLRLDAVHDVEECHLHMARTNFPEKKGEALSFMYVRRSGNEGRRTMHL